MTWTIKGHDWAVDLLRQHIRRGAVRHAYLFTGPPGIGRRTLALQFAQALNCRAADGKIPAKPGDPCQQCRHCIQIGRMQQPDLSIITPEPDSLSIKVEQIRELQYTLSLSPYESRYRIALLADFQTATESAQNAFLKTLEEAPQKAILLLTADSAENLLPTIVSRCEVFRLRPAGVDAARQILAEMTGMPEEEALRLSHLTGGRIGSALSLHQDPSALEQLDQIFNDGLSLLEASLPERFAYADRFRAKNFGNRKEENIRIKKLAQLTLQTWLLLWRDVYLICLQADIPLVNLDWQEKTTALAEKVSSQAAQQQVAALENTLNLLETTNATPQMLMEVLLLDWSKPLEEG
ncbi:MAG: DNA polymerase III subunit [Chloroflexi bacterium]|nr:DNA polymerase III subunit [Chloroflexota bacterium]